MQKNKGYIKKILCSRLTRFQKKVLLSLLFIPKGRVSTYKQVSLFVGSKNSYRAVGNALNKNPFSPIIPCHRVVNSNGCIGGFARTIKQKKLFLEKEGIRFKESKIKKFHEKNYFFSEKDKKLFEKLILYI